MTQPDPTPQHDEKFRGGVPYRWPRGPTLRDPRSERIRNVLIALVVLLAVGLGILLYVMIDARW